MPPSDTPRPSPPRDEPEGRYFRSGLGSRPAVRGLVDADYQSERMQRLRAEDRRLREAGVEFRLAREFGFCYGVERAVDYAYEALQRFPERRIVLTGEIIHNPGVNARLRALGVRFLGDEETPDLDAVTAEDVVVLPAFGVTASDFDRIRATGAIVVDTTCGSVLNVWKNVERYAREGRTSIVHGKAAHEETRATVSRVGFAADAPYLVVLDEAEARFVADAIGGAHSREAFRERFRGRMSEGFDPARDLRRVGMANQTTMLSGESLAIAEIVREALLERYGADELADRYRAFDTICSATQDRQDALRELVAEELDLVLVVGGYNSSNTGHLLEIAVERAPAFHVEGPESLVSREVIRHKPLGETDEVESVFPDGWLPEGEVRVGLTAGASTPDVVIGRIVDRVLALRGGAS